jgi:DNA-binding transcriptional MerR regulator
MKKLRIGEYASLIGLSVSYVRQLEEQDKIHPIRMPSGYRYYNENNIFEAVNLGLISQEEANEVIQQRS